MERRLHTQTACRECEKRAADWTWPRQTFSGGAWCCRGGDELLRVTQEGRSGRNVCRWIDRHTSEGCSSEMDAGRDEFGRILWAEARTSGRAPLSRRRLLATSNQPSSFHAFITHDSSQTLVDGECLLLLRTCTLLTASSWCALRAHISHGWQRHERQHEQTAFMPTPALSTSACITARLRLPGNYGHGQSLDFTVLRKPPSALTI